MKNYLLFLLIGSLSLSLKSQTTISGYIFDQFSHGQIADVKIQAQGIDSLTFSGKNGKFKIQVPPDFSDTLIFSHVDYYPLKKKVWGIDDLLPQKIELLPRSLPIDAFFVTKKKENKQISGKILEINHRDPIAGASLSIGRNIRVAYADVSGVYCVTVPDSVSMIGVSHPDFVPATIYLPAGGKNESNIEVRLKPLHLSRQDTLWKTYKNQVGIAPNEIAIDGIGMRYQRFLKPKFALGLHTTAYILSTSKYFFSSGKTEYSGVKIAPFIRFYSPREMPKGLFGEIKLIGAYMDFNKLNYKRGNSEVNRSFPNQCWNMGAGAALGYYRLLGKADHFVFEIILGIQILPLNVPLTKEFNGTIYRVDNVMWYVGGPGSAVELKLIFGGIF